MKKISLFIFAILITSISSNAQLTKIGGGLVYTTGFHFHNENTGQQADFHRSPFLGIFVTGIYEINLKFHIVPSFTYFIPRTNTEALFPSEKTRVSSMMFDINGHYVFNSLDRFEFYGLAGLDVLLTRLKWVGSSSDHDNAIGLNLGLGTYMKITEQIDLNVEAKYLVSKYHQFMINAGVLFNLQWLSRHENDTK